jgi:DNA-binding beta-propeller fold protein YncE
VQIDGPSRRDFLKQTTLAALIAGLDPLSLTSEVAARAAGTLSGTRVDLLRLLSREFDRNTLKLFAVTSDPVRNRVIVAGILSQYVSILDGVTHRPPSDGPATVDTGVTLFSYKYLAVDTTANRLYIRDTLNSKLSSVHLGTGAITGPIDLPAGLGAIVADSARGLVYVTTTEAPGFRVYDGATLALVTSLTSMGSALLSMVHDPTTDDLYVLDSSVPTPSEAVGRIYRLPLATRIPTTITFTPNSTAARASTMARSRASGRFYVVLAGGITVLTSEGATLHTRALPGLELQDMAFDDTDRRLLALFLDPLSEADRKYSASGGRLYAYSGDTLSGPALSSAALSEIAAFGRKPHTIHVNSATGRFYCAAGDDSTVWSGAANSNVIAGIRIGDSIEDLVLSPPDGTLYMNSRLGGSHVVAYNPVSGAATSFVAGTWPTGMAIDSVGQRLVVLNAWDSTMSVFALPARTLLSTIPIGLPRGTTDRLPDFAVDFTRQRAYAAYPEFGQVAVVDLSAGVALTPLTVDGFTTGDIDGGPNQMQIAVSESAARLHVMSPSLQRLDVYNVAAAPVLVGSQSLPQTVAQSVGRPLWKLLFIDDERGKVFVAGVEREVATGAVTSRALSHGQRVFAADSSRNRYWAAAIEDGAINIYVSDRTSLALVDTYAAGATDTLAPQFALDTARGRLFVSHLVAAQFDSYTVPVTFTDDPLVAGTTALKGVHVTEMRDAINVVRARYGLTAATWTDTITAQTTTVKAAHVTEMRTALAAVYTARGVALPTYTNATLTVGSTTIKAVDVTELRSAIVAIQ